MPRSRKGLKVIEASCCRSGTPAMEARPFVSGPCARASLRADETTRSFAGGLRGCPSPAANQARGTSAAPRCWLRRGATPCYRVRWSRLLGQVGGEVKLIPDVIMPPVWPSEHGGHAPHDLKHRSVHRPLPGFAPLDPSAVAACCSR